MMLGVTMYQGAPKTQNLLIKIVFILPCLNVSHLQSILHLTQCTYRDSSPRLQTVFELVDVDAFDASAVLVSSLPRRQNASL